VRVAKEILSDYQHVIEKLELVTGTKGVFDVAVDDRLIYSKKQTGRHAREGEVLRAFAELVGPDVPRYGE